MRRLTTAAIVAATAVALAGCSGGSPTPAADTTPTTSASPSTSVTSSTPSATTSTTTGRSIAITVTGSTITPAPAQVDLPVGQTLTLVVTSDHDDQLHAHGFEVEEDIKAGVPATIALTGKDPGVYEVELHHPALTLLTVAVR
jgi:plastocyanin